MREGCERKILLPASLQKIEAGQPDGARSFAPARPKNYEYSLKLPQNSSGISLYGWHNNDIININVRRTTRDPINGFRYILGL